MLSCKRFVFYSVVGGQGDLCQMRENMVRGSMYRDTSRSLRHQLHAEVHRRRGPRPPGVPHLISGKGIEAGSRRWNGPYYR